MGKKHLRLGFLSGVAAGILTLVALLLPRGPLGLLQVAYSQVATAIPIVPTATFTPTPNPCGPTPTPEPTSSVIPVQPTPVTTAAPLCPTNTPTPSPSGGGGGGGGGGGAPAAPATAPPTTAAGVAAALAGSAPVSTTATFNASAGGTVLAGNVGLIFSAGSLSGLSGNVTINIVAAPPSIANINAGGPSQFSPNGTLFDVDVRDSAGVHVTTFPQPVVVVFKPNAADLTMAHGNFGLLTAAYVIDADSPPGENPNHYPNNTLVIVAPSSITVDPSTQSFSANLNFIGSVLGVVTNPVGYVQTLKPETEELSSFADDAQSFGTKPQFSYLQVVEPQVGNRLVVLDPSTGNYTYVNAADVGPSGPPPSTSSTAVVRGLRGL